MNAFAPLRTFAYIYYICETAQGFASQAYAKWHCAGFSRRSITSLRKLRKVALRKFTFALSSLRKVAFLLCKLRIKISSLVSAPCPVSANCLGLVPCRSSRQGVAYTWEVFHTQMYCTKPSPRRPQSGGASDLVRVLGLYLPRFYWTGCRPVSVRRAAYDIRRCSID